MKIRQAKKILYSFNKKRIKHYDKLRPSYYDERYGCWISPSWDDIDLMARAIVRLRHYTRKYEC